MTTSEAFALALWLDEYPDNLEYSTILDMIANGEDGNFCYRLIIEYEPPSAKIGYIESTKALFKQYANIAIQESKR